jgi:pimeloyl-ACP methyl ester carboxylesterase
VFAETHTGRVRFRQVGRAATGTPVVLVHGAGAGGAIWLGALRKLARLPRRGLSPDLPGHGRSTGSYATLDQARDALGLFCAAAGVPRAVLIGHSMGGAVALAAALAWPERVAGLGLVASAARFTIKPETVERVGSPTAEAWLSELGFSPATDPAIRRAAIALAFAAPAAVRRADFGLLAGVDFVARLGEIGCPTAVLAGADDLMLPPRRSEEAAQKIRGASLEILPRCGHFPMLEQPDAFAAWLAGLCARTP